MAAITSNTESWNGHSFSEVEAHIKNRLNNIDANGHAYVEIGGLMWATKNVGATAVTDTGLYFQWGDTKGYTASQVGGDEGQKYFEWADYKYNPSGDDFTMTKYNDSDGKTVLEASDDAVQSNWGGSWRMPTIAEFVALGNAVNTAWTASYQGSGVAGMICTDKTDSSKVLFFPAAGYFGDGTVYHSDSINSYWSSSLVTSEVQAAYCLYFNRHYPAWEGSDSRYYGFPVRGVIG